MGGGGGGRRSYTKKTKTIPQSVPQGTGSIFGEDDGCLSLSIVVRLQNVTPAINEVSIGDNLSVSLSYGDNSKIIVVVLNRLREICGTVVHVNVSRLIECLQKEIPFVAHVTNKNGSVCDVQIRARK